MKKNKINTIVFDVNGVLALGVELKEGSSIGKSVHEYVSRKLKVDLDTWFDAIDSVYARSVEGGVSQNKILGTMSKNLHVNPRKLEKLILRAYKRNFRANKKLYRIAFRLKRRGYKIGILSDQWYLSQRICIPNKYVKKFDGAVISCEVGARKPDPKVYKMILKRLRAKAKESVFIDNRDWNLPPAKKLGMKTILFKDNKQALDELRKLGVEI